MPRVRRITLEDLYQRRWELLALTSVGAFMAPLDGSIVSVALPVLSPDLGLSFAASMWVQAAYLLVMAVLLIPVGRLADHFGRVRFYLMGIMIFTIGSGLAGASPGGSWLIASRIVQGVGGAFLAATAAAIVAAVFPPHERGRALGVNVMAVYIGLSVGPPLGGFLTGHLGWRWIFLVNIPIGILVFVWGWLLLPRRERQSAAMLRMDFAGAVLLGSFLVGLLVPLTFASQWGWTRAATVTLLSLSAASLAGFIAVELRAANPVLDLTLLVCNRLFAAANTAALLNYVALSAIAVLTAVYLEVVQGRSPMLAGWLLLSQPAMMAVLSPLSGRLSDTVGSRVLTTGGMVLLAGGMVLLASLSADAGVSRVMMALALAGVGMACFSAPNSSAIFGSVGRRQLGLASAFLATVRVTGQALSIAVLGGIAAHALGPVGGRLLFSHGAGAQGSVNRTAEVVADYVLGYRAAMFTGAALAVVGALVSLVRGPASPRAGALPRDRRA